jgi:hypothetical protein
MDRELAAHSGPVVVVTVGLTEARARGHCGLPMVVVTSREGIGGIVRLVGCSPRCSGGMGSNTSVVG